MEGGSDRPLVISEVVKVARCGTYFLSAQSNSISCSTSCRGEGGGVLAYSIDATLPMYSAERAIMNYWLASGSIHSANQLFSSLSFSPTRHRN